MIHVNVRKTHTEREENTETRRDLKLTVTFRKMSLFKHGSGEERLERKAGPEATTGTAGRPHVDDLEENDKTGQGRSWQFRRLYP